MLTIEELKEEFPQYEKLVTESLRWLDEQEPHWNLKNPIDKTKFVNDLVVRAMVANRDF